MEDASKPVADDTVVPSAVEPPPVPKPRPWGFWATLGFGVLVFFGAIAALIFSMLFMAVVLSISREGTFDFERLNGIDENAFVYPFAFVAVSATGISLILLFTHIRKGIKVEDYLAFCSVPSRQLQIWVFVIFLSSAICIAIKSRFALPVDIDVDVRLVHGVIAKVGLFGEFFAMPVFTILLFQGFLLRGFRESALGPVWGTVLTIALWLGLYSMNGDVVLALEATVYGILYTWGRVQTGSTLTPCLMYSTERLVAVAAVLMFDLPMT